MRITQPRSPASDEPCREREGQNIGSEEGFFLAPQISDKHHGGLNSQTRKLARLAADGADGPVRVLVEAVLGLARYNGNPPTDTTGMTPRELYTADFAVTGRGAYERFRALRISDADLIARARAESREQGTHTTYSDAMLQAGVRAALDRVYQVAWALRGPVAHRREHRRRLGWIGVSGEDDPPARPVNVPSAEFPQYEIDVPVGGSRVKTRFMIASPSNDPHSATFNPRALPPDFTPIVPDGDRVLLFIHGHSSRLEEALSLVPHLHALGRSRGRRYSIIAVDLPSCGYSEFLDHEAIAPKRPTRYDHPILEFIEEFLIAFVEQLDARTPIRNRIDAVIGGSLGGNMSLRLGRWAGTRLPWLRTVVSWSPASVWDSLLASSFDPFKKKACDDTWAGAIEKESSQTRAGFFKAVFDKDTIPLLLGAQPELWFRDGWRPCKENSIRRARYERFEIYHPQHRRWHWRVAHEQLVFSHRDPYTERGVPSYQAIGARTLLAAGSEDNFIGTNIYDATRGLAVLLRNAPGEGLFLRDTGHSIHAERPGLFAEHIAAFLPPPRPDGLQGEQWTRWESIGGSLTSEPVFQEQEDGRLCIFGRGQDGRPCFTVESAPGTRFEGWRALTDNLGTDERVEEPMAVGANEDGRLQLFATLGDRVVHVSQTAPNARWGAWEKGNAFSQLIGGAAPGVAVVERVGSGPSRLLLAISRRQNGRIHIRGQNRLGSWWMNGKELPDAGKPFIGTPTAGLNRNHCVAIFARTSDGVLRTIRERNPDEWHDRWEDLGPVTGDPAVAEDMGGCLHVFARNPNGELGMRRQQSPGGSWSPWQSLGGELAQGTKPAVVRNAWGDLQVVVRWQDGSLRTCRQRLETGWTEWKSLGGIAIQDPAVGVGRDGSLVVAHVGRDRAVYVSRQSVAALEHKWTFTNGRARDIGVGADGSVYVVGTDTDVPAGNGKIYRWSRSRWKLIGGFGMRIAADPKGNWWIVNTGNEIWGPNGKMPGFARDIGIGADGSIYIIGTNTDVPAGNGKIYRWSGSRWDLIGGFGMRIAVDPRGNWWIVNTGNEIWGPYGKMPGTARDIGIGADGSIYVIGTDATSGGNFGIHRWAGTRWVRVAGEGVAISVDPEGKPWVVKANGDIMRFEG